MEQYQVITNILLDLHKSRIAELQGHHILDHNHQKVAEVRGKYIFDKDFNKVAELRGDDVLDTNFRKLGSVSSIRKLIDSQLDDATLAAFWLFFIRQVNNS